MNKAFTTRLAMARHFRGSGVVLRFIEYMDVGNRNDWQSALVVPSRELRDANIGAVPLTSVQPAIGLCSFWMEPSTKSGTCERIETRLVLRQWFVHELKKDEKQVIRLDDLFRVASPARFGGADISIVISYYPWFIPIKREIEFRFVTRKEMDGMLSWVPQPLDK